MSNASLFSRLESELDAFQRKERSASAFCDTLVSNIEGLEQMPYSTIQEMRAFRHRVEVGGFTEEEGCVFDRDSVAKDIRIWLSTLKKRPANQTAHPTTL